MQDISICTSASRQTQRQKADIHEAAEKSLEELRGLRATNEAQVAAGMVS